MGDEVALAVTQRAAVDITGEHERIRRLLVETETLLRRLGYQVNRRTHREQWAPQHVGLEIPLTESPRLKRLLSAQEYLGYVREELLAAYLASGTMTDEIPF